MWLFIAVILVMLGLAWFARQHYRTKKNRGPRDADLYICTNCGKRHCDCHKKPPV